MIENLLLSTYVPVWNKKPRKQINLPQFTSVRIWTRPGYLKVLFHLFRIWLNKEIEGNQSNKEKRTADRPFYPNPIFLAISSFSGLIVKSVLVNIPKVMDERD